MRAFVLSNSPVNIYGCDSRLNCSIEEI